MNLETIGLIGIGNIGRVFTEKLLAAGKPLTVFDLDPARVAWAAARGAHAAASPRELASASDLILLSLPGNDAVACAMRGVLNGIRRGSVVCDTGTTHPDLDRRLARLCAKRGIGFLDTPITWRAQGLIFMAGGEKRTFARAEPILKLLAYKLRHIGPLGSGQLLKLANQIVLAGQWATWAETIEYLRRGGLDARLLKEYLEFPVAEGLFGEDFSGGGQLALHCKDLRYARHTGHQLRARLPLTRLVSRIFDTVNKTGNPRWTQMAIVTYWRSRKSKK